MIKALMKQQHCNELHIQYDAPSDCVFIAAMNTEYGERGNGGTRMMPYKDITEAIKDATRLVNVMTKKCIIIGKKYSGGYSGGKGVIMGDPQQQKTPQMLRRYGAFIESLHGRLQTGTDMNIGLKDIKYMAETCHYVDGLETGLGDTGIPTAHGVHTAMKVWANATFGNASLHGKVVAVQGVGSVGSHLIEKLTEEGAHVVATDVDAQKLATLKTRYGCDTVEPDAIFDVECDIFSPNAVGGVLTSSNIRRLRCAAVLGGANNPLADGMRSVEALEAKKVMYVPDYVVNIGGVFLSMCETQGKNFEYVMEKTKEIITRRLVQFLQEAQEKTKTVYEVAEQFVLQELEKSDKDSLR